MKDSSFVAVGLPDSFVSIKGLKAPNGWSGEGTWLIRSGKMSENIDLRFKSFNGRPVDYGAELSFKEWAPSSQLFYFVGDPDDAHIVSFKRVATQ